MQKIPLTKDDEALIEVAIDIIKQHYEPDWHHIGAALRTASGKVYSSVHLDASVGLSNVCAEAIALGKAVSEGHYEPAVVVAVRHPRPQEKDQSIRLVSPCGNCRELLSDYGPDCLIILSDDGQLFKTPVAELIPMKYKRKERASAPKMK